MIVILVGGAGTPGAADGERGRTPTTHASERDDYYYYHILNNTHIIYTVERGFVNSS